MEQTAKKTSKIRIAIYDMDKTVTRSATYNGFLLHMARNRSPMRLLLTPLLLIGVVLYAMKFWDRSRLKEFSQGLMLGSRIKLDELDAHLQSYAKLTCDENVYPELCDLVREEKSGGYRHVLATASYRLYVSAIAEKLGFDDVVATELVVDDGGNVLARIDGQNCYDQAKLVKVKAWMAEQGLSRADCHIRAYSDHVSDAPLLDFADEAYATNPHPPLAELAAKKGWQLIDWR